MTGEGVHSLKSLHSRPTQVPALLYAAAGVDAVLGNMNAQLRVFCLRPKLLRRRRQYMTVICACGCYHRPLDARNGPSGLVPGS